MLLAQGQRLEAIRELNEYLSTFVNDTEAWMQLSDLYLQESDYTRAAFCFEELILANVRASAAKLVNTLLLFSRKTVHTCAESLRFDTRWVVLRMSNWQRRTTSVPVGCARVLVH